MRLLKKVFFLWPIVNVINSLFQDYGPCSMVNGLWSMVYGLWSMVYGHGEVDVDDGVPVLLAQVLHRPPRRLRTARARADRARSGAVSAGRARSGEQAGRDQPGCVRCTLAEVAYRCMHKYLHMRM